MYQKMAHLYDWPGALAFSDSIAQKIKHHFDQHTINPPAHILDLACGTGTLSLQLAAQGFKVTGIDLEAAMLAVAQQKMLTSGLSCSAPIEWIEADMRFFTLEHPADVVVCHYDSLNHLSNETELRATFIQVANALKPGGWFLFDLNTLENYQTHWQGKDTYEGPNYRLKTRSEFNEQLQQASVSFYADEYQEEGQLVCLEEVLYEQYFNELAVEQYLLAAGLTNIQYHAFNPFETPEEDIPVKTFWRCQKTTG